LQLSEEKKEQESLLVTPEFSFAYTDYEGASRQKPLPNGQKSSPALKPLLALPAP
jgi:hypothetical protein